MSARAFGFRISLVYAFLFLGMGVQLPFLPLWLKDKGLSDTEIAAIVAAMILIRIVAAPLGAFIADRNGSRRGVMIWSAAFCVLGYAAMARMQGFVPILLTGVAAQAFFSPIVPLAENMAVEGSLRHRLDYGRPRLWGSLSFIGGSLAAGAALGAVPVSGVIVMIVAGQALLALICLTLPPEPAAAPPRDNAGRLRIADALRLFALPSFVLFVAAASLGQASHGLLYTFGSVHWHDLGYGEPVIGLLWGISVATEIVLFFFSDRAVKRFGPANLVILGTAGGLLRWLVMAGDPPLWLLIPSQALHGLSFSAVHLGTMHYIQRAVPQGLRNTAQGVFTATSGGLVMGAAMLASAPLYDAFAGLAYLAMAALSAAALGFALKVRRVSPTAPAGPGA